MSPPLRSDLGDFGLVILCIAVWIVVPLALVALAYACDRLDARRQSRRHARDQSDQVSRRVPS